MERVAFLIERTGERISCLLNPESFTFRRSAGLRRRVDRAGIVTGSALQDDPLVATGGGSTELALELLFDVDLAAALAPVADVPEGSESFRRADVRDLTRPFWNLSENAGEGYGAPPVVRLIWGRAWNVPGVVTAVAERLERFDGDGAPQRSWMSLRMRRVADMAATAGAPSAPVTPLQEFASASAEAALDDALRVEIVADEGGLPANRLDQLAHDQLGDARHWPLIAAANGIENPLAIEAGTIIAIPGRSERGSVP